MRSLGPSLLLVAAIVLIGAVALFAESNLAGPVDVQSARLALAVLATLAAALAGLAFVQHVRAARRKVANDAAEAARVRELKETDRRKDEFLAILGHELRNPLAPIHMALHVLDSNSAPAETVGRAREILSDQVRLMTRIVEDVMDASRISLGKVRLEPEPFDLAELMKSVAASLEPAFGDRQQTLTLGLPPAPTMVTLDPRRTRQILQNLLVNASKFTEPGGSIRLEGAADARTVTLRVVDDGQGLTPAQVAHVFHPFAQGDGARSHVDGGLGIGLTLARNLAELHGGTIEASSPGPGRGSSFTVRVPRSAF
jgi:signal transduction histidine kinase